jgi:molybdenum storage protein
MARIARHADERIHIEGRFTRESLVDKQVIASTATERELRILPTFDLIGIGGQSIFDRGRTALFPLVEELAKLHKRRRFVLGCGGGTRVRHTYAIGLDLGLPTGGLAQLAGAMEEQNAIMLQALLARRGSILMAREHFWELPLYLNTRMIPIVISIPPYHFWEPPPDGGPLPGHGSDFGLFIVAEVLGLKRLILLKDVDGVYTRDPKKAPDAERIPRVSAQDLLAMRLPELPIDHQLLAAMVNARNVEAVHVVNGLVPGNLSKALAGRRTGSVITRKGAGR